MGLLVTDFLFENFGKVMDYNFTADIEKQFDIIAEGNLVWNKMIADFYGPFHQTVEETPGSSRSCSWSKGSWR